MFSGYKKFLKWGLSTFGVAIIYISGMLFFREIHPFSRFPMYSSFPNWAYSFYLTNESDEVIPFSTINTDGGAIGHLYGSVSDEFNIPYGEFMESKEELNKIGDRILNIILHSEELNAKKLKLYRKAFYYQNDTIRERTDLMTLYENR
jgi:hypothetical protein